MAKQKNEQKSLKNFIENFLFVLNNRRMKWKIFYFKSNGFFFCISYIKNYFFVVFLLLEKNDKLAKAMTERNIKIECVNSISNKKNCFIKN